MFAWRRTLERRTVIVNLTSGKAFRGVCWARRGPLVVLRHVELVETGRPPLALDGEIVVERAMIDFTQVLPAPARPVAALAAARTA